MLLKISFSLFALRVVIRLLTLFIRSCVYSLALSDSTFLFIMALRIATIAFLALTSMPLYPISGKSRVMAGPYISLRAVIPLGVVASSLTPLFISSIACDGDIPRYFCDALRTFDTMTSTMIPMTISGASQLNIERMNDVISTLYSLYTVVYSIVSYT